MNLNLHLWDAGRGTYYDNNVDIISWSDQYKVKLGRYNSIGRGCKFFLHANHRADWVTTSSQLFGPVTPEIADMHMKMGHPTCKGDIIVENDVWIGAKSLIMSGIKIRFRKEQIENLLNIAWWDWDKVKIKDRAMDLWSDDINKFINANKNLDIT